MRTRVDRRLQAMRRTMGWLTAAALVVGFAAGLLAATANPVTPCPSRTHWTVQEP